MRADRIRHVRTLEYYDGILLFEARDPIGATYAASHIGPVEEGDVYLLVGCEPERLRLHRHGIGELRNLLQESADFGWCRAVLTDIDEPLTVIGEFHTRPIPDDYLPSAGPSFAEYDVVHEVARRARAERNTVVEISIDPPRIDREGLAPAATLVRLLRRIETLTQRAALHSVARDRGLDPATVAEERVGQLDVAEIARGSVKVTFQELNMPDPREESPLARALEYLDDMVESVGNSEDIAAAARTYNPGVVAAYAGLVRFLRDQRTGFSYTWSAPVGRTVSHRAISFSDARKLARELPTLKGDYLISERGVFLEGELEMADRSKGTWRLNDPVEGRQTGVVEGGGPDLGNLTIGNEYALACREEIRMDERRGLPTTTLYLLGIRPSGYHFSLVDDSL